MFAADFGLLAINGQAGTELVDLESLIRSVVVSFEPDSSQKNPDIVLDCDEAIPVIVKSDLLGLRQVLPNLTIAIQDSEARGIKISLRCISTTDLYVPTELAFQDDSDRLADSQLDSIFQDFEKILDDGKDENETSYLSNDAKFVKTEITAIGLGLAFSCKVQQRGNLGCHL
ncbi:hypothetical protein EG329_008769 [Mollisiaceae sp. DMI_Dod_QoI]|nr:hypothetical protein EG329_008769 [Helotiales sp. DMI_Dod_QoI]